METKIRVHNEVSIEYPGGKRLCFQWCTYVYKESGKADQRGYRFIWRRANNNLQAARGQARIPNAADLSRLIELAREAGWFERCELTEPTVA